MGAEQCLPLRADDFRRDISAQLLDDFCALTMQVSTPHHSPLGGYANTHPVLFTFRRLSKMVTGGKLKRFHIPKHGVNAVSFGEEK